MVTPKQIAALKYMIFVAKNGTDLSKRILAFLLDKSENLSKEVCMNLAESTGEYTSDEVYQAGIGVGAMQSGNCTTHLHEILEVTGTGLNFSVHYGDFDPSRKGDPCNTDGQFAGWDSSQVTRPGLVREGMPMRYTFWLACKDYSRKATLVVATREELEAIDLKKSGLYNNH